MRIQKFIADCGVCSRRAAEVLVQQGKVIVNGTKAVIGQNIDEENDRIVCEGRRIHLKACNKQYFIFYKPRGVITSMKAQDDRSVLSDLIKGINGRVYPVGRLDRDSEGLILLTDDGETAQKMTHPSHEIDKTYRVTVKGNPSDDQLNCLRNGVEIHDEEGNAFTTAPAGVIINNQKDDKTILHVTIHEGKNRQIRRMCDVVGIHVLLLKRIAVGELTLGHLAPGAYRPLTNSEIHKLLESLGIDPSTKIIKKTHQDVVNVNKLRNEQKRRNTKSIYAKKFVKQFGSKNKKIK